MANGGCGRPGHVTGGEGLTHLCVTCEEEGRRARIINRYQELVNKDFASGLSKEESQEAECLGGEIDSWEEPSND